MPVLDIIFINLKGRLKMKKLLLLVVIAFSAGMLNYALALEKIEKVEIKTSAICEHCKERIEGALDKMDGVKKSDLDLDTKIVKVEFDSEKISVDKIKTEITKTGYNADELKRDFKAYKKLPKCCKEGH